MRWYSTTLATDFPGDDWRVRLLYVVLFFIPKANPDFEPLYPKVRRWLVEVDDDGESVREIGLDEHGAAITVGPWERNYGLWTDSPGPFPAESAQEISQAEFDRVWASFQGLNCGA